MFQGQLDKPCDISATDAYEQIARSRRPHWKEDFAFLENQRESQTFYMTQLDTNASELARRPLAKKSKYQDQKQKSSTSHLSLTDDDFRRQLEELSSDDETDWDSKLIQLILGRKEECVAVLISGSVEG